MEGSAGPWGRFEIVLKSRLLPAPFRSRAAVEEFNLAV